MQASSVLEDRSDKPDIKTWLLVFALYVTQGVPLGVAFEALPAILRAEGTSPEVIGFVGIMILPWALKFLWAPRIDRFSGKNPRKRRAFIIPMQLLLAGLFFAIVVWPKSAEISMVVLVILFIANIVSATQDIATDGLVIEEIGKAKFGWVNSIQIGGFAAGMLLGGAATLALYDWGGWTASFLILGAGTLLTLLPLIFYRSPGPEHDLNRRKPDLVRPSIKRFFSRKHAWLMVSVAASFYFARAVAGSMTGPFLVDKSFALSTIALINGVGIVTVTIAAAGLAGLIIQQIGATKTAIGSGALAAVTLFLWLIPSLNAEPSLALILTVLIANGIASGVAYVSFYTLFMTWSSSDQAGTDFSILQSTETITNIIAAISAGTVVGWLGYSTNFTIAGIIGVTLIFWIIAAIFRIKPSDKIATHK